MSWLQKIQDTIEYDDIVKYCRMINMFTISVKLRSFQYRLLMNGIITNVQLKKYKIKQTDQCIFCNAYKEIIEHLFIDCKNIQVLWSYIREKFENARLTKFNIITNLVVDNPKQVENVVILITKFYIYKTRCNEKQVATRQLQEEIEQFKQIKKVIAKSKTS